MLSEDDFQIFWNNESIGLLSNPMPDMWYLEGRWTSDKTTAAVDFESAVKKSQSKDVFNNLARGIEVSLRDREGNSSLAIIIALTNGNIFLRRIAVSLK